MIDVAVQNAYNIKKTMGSEDTSDPSVYWSTCDCQPKAERVATPYISDSDISNSATVSF